MKIILPKKFLDSVIHEAKEGYGRETEIGGGNTQVDITVLKLDVAEYPGLEKLARGTVRVILNRHGQAIGHKVFGPRPKKALTNV